MGECTIERSASSAGAWTSEPHAFDNTYFVQLLHEQYEEAPTTAGQTLHRCAARGTIMLPIDMALLSDRSFRKWVETYATDPASACHPPPPPSPPTLVPPSPSIPLPLPPVPARPVRASPRALAKRSAIRRVLAEESPHTSALCARAKYPACERLEHELPACERLEHELPACERLEHELPALELPALELPALERLVRTFVPSGRAGAMRLHLGCAEFATEFAAAWAKLQELGCAHLEPHPSSLTYASSCYLPNEWVDLPLISRREMTHDTTIYGFGLPRDTTLSLPACACIMLKAVGRGRGAHGEDDWDGSDAVRPYVPISDPAMRGKFELLVKRYPNGAVSSYLHALPLGAKVGFRHIRFNLKAQYPFDGKKTFTMICGGTGITPMFQVRAQPRASSRETPPPPPPPPATLPISADVPPPLSPPCARVVRARRACRPSPLPSRPSLLRCPTHPQTTPLPRWRRCCGSWCRHALTSGR